jgi:hypothetical protein
MTTEDRAAVLAAILVAGSRAPEILARLGAARGERCVAEAKRLLALPTEERVRALTAEARFARAEVPANLHLVHATWLEAAVDGERDEVRAAVAGRGTAQPSVRAWLRRRAFGAFVAMPAEDSGALAAQPPEKLAAEIEIRGRQRLAIATQAAPPGAAAALAARLGPLHAKSFVEEVRAVAPKETIRAAVRELGDLMAADDPGPTAIAPHSELLFRCGARHLAFTLAGDEPRQIAQRLPRPRGLLLILS